MNPTPVGGNKLVPVIRIQQHDFQIPTRYSEGHVCSAADAIMLNQIFCENVRNNVANWVSRIMDDLGVTVLSDNDLSSLRKRIYQYASNYQFRPRERARPPSPIEVAANELALKQAEIEGQQNGYTPDSDEVKLRYLQLKSDPDILSRAREIVARRAAIVEEMLDDC